MKKILFASVIAFMAIFATSCKDKNAGDAPKARFAYAVDGMVVTFTNASKDATDYVWDFGDGTATSAEVNPVHEYAEAGTYAVKLTAKNKAGENSFTDNIVLEKPLFAVTIDGDFEDWNNLPADLVAVAEVDDNATMDALHVIKFITNPDYLFFYIQYSGVEDEVGVLDIFINADDNAETGHASWLWVDAGADILIEGGTDIDTETETELWWPDFFTFIDGSDQAEWAWESMDAEGMYLLSEIRTLANGDKAIEGKIMRAGLPNFTACKVGVLAQAPEWAGEVGNLPETHVTDGAAPMLEVKLN